MKPRFNQYQSSFSSRYVLGIEGIAPSMQNIICPVVNTVTPRPYYWAFFTWCYYDYYKHEEQLRETIGKVNEYIRRNNYYIAIGALLNGYRTVSNFIGADTIDGMNIVANDPCEYRDTYVKGLSTMGNYYAGIADGETSMNLVLMQNLDTNEKYAKPKITPSGEKLALAFDKVIRNTRYYKEYRLYSFDVPRDVLVELGQVVRVDLSTFPECRELLKEYLFERERCKKLRESKDYVDYIYRNLGIKLNDREEARKILYDQYSVRALADSLPEEHHDISVEWETVIGRQYMVIGIQMIWKYMLKMLAEPLPLEQWLDECISTQKYSFDINTSLESILEARNYGSSELESIIAGDRKYGDSTVIERALNVLISVYNRFLDRSDLTEIASGMLDLGQGDNSISMNQLFRRIEEYKELTVRDFIYFLMKEYIVHQHLETAFGKMITNNVDGFYIEKLDHAYRRKEWFYYDFQILRVERLTSVMNDLECF